MKYICDIKTIKHKNTFATNRTYKIYIEIILQREGESSINKQISILR